MKWILIAIFFTTLGCYKSSPFEFEHIENPHLKYSKTKEIEGRFGKKIFIDKDSNLEIHVSKPIKISKEMVQQAVSERVNQFNNLFLPRMYKTKTKVVTVPTCDSAFSPLEDSLSEAYHFVRTVYATAGYAMPACIPEDVYYKASYIIIYCEAYEELYEVRLFSKAQSRQVLDEFGRGLHCRPK